MTGNTCWICGRTEQEVVDEIGTINMEDGTPLKNMLHVIANKDDDRLPNVPLYFCRGCGVIFNHLTRVAVKQTLIERDEGMK